MNKINLSIIVFAMLALSGCGFMGKVVNPFYEEPSKIALQGEANDHALNGSGMKEDSARQALEQMSSYQRANSPSPDKPVIQPAVVRLMWIPDHLNKHGDLVPSHYYYLKVLKDRWAVTDAFELENQLKRGGGGSNIPYVFDGDIKK
ncbi:MAG: hypothetical protein ACOX2O_01965 [Bdellovibrionota bacterium]